MSKQYEVVDEIKVLDKVKLDNEDIKSQSNNETVTQMTDVTDMTHFKCAIPLSSCQNTNADNQCNEDNNDSYINNKVEDKITETKDEYNKKDKDVDLLLLM